MTNTPRLDALDELDLEAAGHELKRLLFLRCIERLQDKHVDPATLKVARDVLKDFSDSTPPRSNRLVPDLPFGDGVEE